MASPAPSLPDSLEPDLVKILEYWKNLIRGENSMPFSDDLDLSRLSKLSTQFILLKAFENPDRFRFEIAGDAIVQSYGSFLLGQFSDELEQKPPLEGLTEQCHMTVAQRAPTYSRSSNAARLLLPTWGEGHVQLLLGAVVKAS
jgi:hypothetical protein